MRHRMCILGGWLLWVSLGSLAGVVVIALVGPVVAANSENAGGLLLTILKATFAFTAASFLLGMICHLVEGSVGERRP